ncbi:DgyrCDS3993 [Dimorphilus gyrociliatus]|uniref:DgyrCDS3993 n=1 Tax=Dimorphilus gyrociliatus TaxID=2664684 RepID=A0A7I8VI68_9ANNE|nr:DgyrCDS3993 [Dimorphilus gyrociliatus]
MASKSTRKVVPVSKISSIPSIEADKLAASNHTSNSISPPFNTKSMKTPTKGKELTEDFNRQAIKTKWNRNKEFGKILIVCCVPIVILLIESIIAVVNALVLYNLTVSVKDSISFSVQISGVIHALQKERGSTALFVSSKGSPEVFEDLSRFKYVETDEALTNVKGWRKTASSPRYLDSRQSLHEYIKENRRNLDGKTSPVNEQITFFSEANKALIQILVDGIIIAKNLPQWNDLVAFHLLIHGKEMTGKERAIGSTFFGRGYMPQSDLVCLKEQTDELQDEKQKTKFLLLRILPGSIAERLLSSEEIEPEHFESATVYFSDIVGFTDISARSTPLEVVDMLNMLYKLFDEKTDNYDVYKVETIGDAYMVASGVPRRNGYSHAKEIANMALDLLHSVGTLSVWHLDNSTLKLRIGMNSGPVVAGVVGLKMPRYCLFGKTVNRANLMESKGLPQCIHISSSTFDLLTLAGGFQFQERESTQIQGSEEIITYWLIGSAKWPSPKGYKIEEIQYKPSQTHANTQA